MRKRFYYVIDGLTSQRSRQLKRALQELPGIGTVVVRPDHGIVEVEANREPEPHVKLACSIVGTAFRVKVKRRDLF